MHNKPLVHLALAGKLAIQSSSVAAGGIGKTENSAISLDEIPYPIEILTPPVDSEQLNQNTFGVASSNGRIFSEEINTAFSSGKLPRIDFIVNNLPIREEPIVVFLAYSTKPGDPSQWADLQMNLSLDRETLQIIAGVQTTSMSSSLGFPQTPLGFAPNTANSVVIPVQLSSLGENDFPENTLYFQTIAVPVVNGEYDFSQAAVSEMDEFVIERSSNASPNNGSKVVSCPTTDDSGGKTFDDSSNDGGKSSGDDGKSSGGTSDSGGK